MASEFAGRLGAEVARRRRAGRLTQEALAERIDATPEWVSQIERGVGNPSFPTLEALAAAFGVTVNELLIAASSTETRTEVVATLAAIADGLSDRDARLLLAFAKEMANVDEARPARRSRRSRRRAA